METLKYQILPELNLIIDVWFGALTFDKILAAKLEQVKDPLWNQRYNNISDVRNALFSLSNEEAARIIDYTRQDTRWQYKRKTAYLTENPNQVVFEKILEMNKTQDIPNSMMSFSTLQAALRWLQIDAGEYERIDGVIREIRDGKW